MRSLLLFLFTLTLSFSNTQLSDPQVIDEPSVFDNNGSLEDENLSETEEPRIQAKLLYQSYYNLPKKLFKGQIFTLTIKALSAQDDYESLNYNFSKAYSIKKLAKEKERRIQAPYFYDTFYFQVTGGKVRVPNIKTTLVFSDLRDSMSETLKGTFIETVRLNPEDDFSNVLANKFTVLDYKTTQYDNQHNIVVFSAEAQMGNLNDFSLKSARKEGIDAYEENLPYSTFTYYAVVSKQLNELKFTYFNLKSRRFVDVIIPIIVSNDRVSTQTDLAPTQNTHSVAKMILAGVVSFTGLLLFIFRRNKFYLLIFIAPLFLIAKLAVPIKHVCIQTDSNIYLLPMKNGTIFEQVPYQFTTEVLGTSQNFTKIRMKNRQIGWVKDENLCKP